MFLPYALFFATVGLAAAIIACFLTSKPVKVGLSVVSFLMLLIFASMATMLSVSRYTSGNYAWLTFAVSGLVYLALMLLAWKPFSDKITQKTQRIIAFSIIGVSLVLAIAVVAPDVYRRSITIVTAEGYHGDEIYLAPYSPFGRYTYNSNFELEHTPSLAASLDEASSLKMTDNFPRLDGATALYPLYAAFAQATYPEPEPRLDIPEYFPYMDLRDDGAWWDDVEDPDKDPFIEPLVVCSKTSGAFENLIDGYADIVFLMGVSDEQMESASRKGLEIVLTPVGREAFVFFVHSRNSIDNLSQSDIRGIYSGDITNWQEVGGRDDIIRAYQRPEASGSQVMLRQIMGDNPIVDAPEDDVFDMMMGMVTRVVSYRNYRNSLGYSFMYYVTDMVDEHNIKFLSIDNVAPTRENIESGAYPYANDFYAVTIKRDGEYLNAERTENIDNFLSWMVSPQGQYLVEATGYTRARRMMT